MNPLRLCVIPIAAIENGLVYVPARPLWDHPGVDWSAQRLRINRDPVLSDVAMGLIVTITPQSGPPQRQEMMCLPLDYRNGFRIRGHAIMSEGLKGVINLIIPSEGGRGGGPPEAGALKH